MTGGTMRPFSSYARPQTQARARAAVRGLRLHVDPGYTLARLVDDALTAWCEHLERTHHEGQPWPGGLSPLPAGRR